ncbi:MAG: hypothetical protein IMW89_20525 [Ktedonobacteraceae bacterium]|nr:hypothetical protein [Ktedonobacteraceae bacterium]
MITSPTPTQQQPPRLPEPAKKEVKMTPVRRGPGQSPFARFVKGIFRPIFKGIYYLIQAIRGHKLVTLGAILLLLASMSTTTYLVTGKWPLGIANDQFNFHIRGGDGGGEQVKNWLYALRDGDVVKLSLIQSQLIMSQPPDPNELVGQFSQPKAHLTWKAINVMGVYTQPDSTVDSFVSIDFTGPGPGGAVKGVMIWHFTTLPQDQGRLLFVHLVTLRQSLT